MSGCIAEFNRFMWGAIKYHPAETPARVIEMGKEGKTNAQMASALGVSLSTFRNWLKEHEEFNEAYEVAKTHAQALKEEKLEKLAFEGGEGNSNAFMFLMKHQFKDDYTEVKQVNTTSTLSVQGLPDDQLNKKLAAKLKLLSADERKALFGNPIIEGEFEEITVNEGG